MNRLFFTLLIAAAAVGLSALPSLFPGASLRPVAVANLVTALLAARLILAVAQMALAKKGS